MNFLVKPYILFALIMCLIAGCRTEDKATSDADSETPETETKDKASANFVGQQKTGIGEQIVNYAASLEGTPYKEAGRDISGFDCSGFIYYVYKKYSIDVPHSSRHLAELGTEVDTSKAQPGDLVFFRGTKPDNPEVGHVGIVVSRPGEPIKFIHASSATSSPHVKYDSLARPNYNRRFLKVKRLLKDGELKN
jgi:cell wall-associated NlpC family hydrolase